MAMPVIDLIQVAQHIKEVSHCKGGRHGKPFFFDFAPNGYNSLHGCISARSAVCLTHCKESWINTDDPIAQSLHASELGSQIDLQRA